MSDEKRHAEHIRRLRDSGGVPVRGHEVLQYPNESTRNKIRKDYRLDSKDEGESKRGLKKFQQSSEYKRFSPYRKRFY